MRPRLNKQGGFNFMTLGSMKNMVGQSWDALPMPDTVISRVKAFGQGQPNDPNFLDRAMHPIGELKIIGLDDG